jgi:hypothetical protein
MRLTRLGLRIAAFAGAATLAAGLTAVSVPAAQAATLHTICNTNTGFCLEGGDHFEVRTTDGNYYQYEDTNNNDECLQVNVADTTLTEGGCTDSTRQFFWYDKATLFVNLAYNTEAYVNVVYMHGFSVDEVDMGAFEGDNPNPGWSINDVS